MTIMAKYGHFEYVVEYPIWVSIKRYWTGKLALACQNWIYCIRLKENVKKLPKIAVFQKHSFLDCFLTFSLKNGHTGNFGGHFLITNGPNFF